jgi:hypothetical protein
VAGASGDEPSSPSLPAIGLVLLINLPLALRRRHPLAVGTLVAAAAITYGVAPYPDLAVPVPLGAVNLFGGDLDAGPRPDGGFAVAARLPLPLG